MTDRRMTPVNERVAAMALKESYPELRHVEGDARQIAQPVVDLINQPDGVRERQLLFGETVTVYEDRDGWSFVQSMRDGYVGYVRSAQLGPHQAPSHWITAPATVVYQRPDLKSPDLHSLSFGSFVTVSCNEGDYLGTDLGFLPKTHLSRVDETMADPVEVAALMLGTPYLWGGNSRFGIDCSGLVQMAMISCGLDCPGDSDQQERLLGISLPEGSKPRRGDLLFWKGHVALVADTDVLLHANAFHMAVSYEGLTEAIARISEQGGGPVTTHKRLPLTRAGA